MERVEELGGLCYLQQASFELGRNKWTESRFRGIISILHCSKQRKMQIIPLNLDSVLLFLHNSKLAYCVNRWTEVKAQTKLKIISTSTQTTNHWRMTKLLHTFKNTSPLASIIKPPNDSKMFFVASLMWIFKAKMKNRSSWFSEQ